MNRRDVLKLLGGAGVCAVGPVVSGRAAAQQAAPRRHFVFVHAGGGWDPTSLCDPKGDVLQANDRGPINHYLASDIRQARNSVVRYAPFPDPELATSTPRDGLPVTSFANFFDDVGQDLLVINGIDTQTNSHTIGTRTTWSGSAKLGQPAFAALVARAQAPDSPLAFITNGGYDTPAGLVAPARVSGSGALRELAAPERYDLNPSADPQLPRTQYLAPDVNARIDAARLARRQRLLNAEPLPQRRAAMARLFMAGEGDSGLHRLVEAMPADVSPGLRGQAEVAVAAFEAQVAVSANLSVGGFDTHGDHDRNQTESLAELVDGVHHLWRLLRARGLTDRVTVLVSSDFGRTPFYNDGGGKDHWNVTSMLALGAGVAGNRIVGGTDDAFRTLALDRRTLEPSDSGNGVILTPGHIHQALRQMTGVRDTDAARAFPLDGELLPIFG